MEIRSFTMRDLAEDAFAHHAQHHHLDIPVATILQNDAMLSRGLGSINDIPALLQSRAGWHFNGSMFAVFHGIERHRNVPVPGRRYVDDIQIELSQIPEIRFTLAESPGLGLSRIRNQLLSV